MTDDADATTRELLDRVTTDPQLDDVADLYEYVDAEEVAARKRALRGLRIAASRQPSILEDVLADDARELRERCSDGNASVRSTAAVLLGTAWPLVDTPADEVVDALAPLLTDELPLVRTNALEGLKPVSRTNPGALVPVATDLVALLDADVGTRTSAALLVSRVATADGSSVASGTDRILELLEGETGIDVDTVTDSVARDADLAERLQDIGDDQYEKHRYLRMVAGDAIVEIAADHPSSVVPVASDLASLLSDPDPQVRDAVADAFVALAADSPDVVASHADALAACLVESEADFVRASLVRALAVAGADAPDAVAPTVVDRSHAVEPLLEHDEPSVRGGAAAVLALAGDVDPESVASVADRLGELADDEEEYVAAAAADALDRLE